MSRTAKSIMYVVLGIVIAVALFCVAVGIGCAVNGLTFSEQVVDWFTKKEVADAVEGSAEAVALFM